MQTLRDVLGNAIEQEGRGLSTQSTIPPGAQQCAIEQDGRCVRVRGHAGWYADLPISGNPTLLSLGRVGIPFVYDPGPGLLSMEAIANPPAYARARAAVRYDDVARTLVHALKYQDRTDLAPAMGRWMARAGRELLGEADALVPVPLHWRRGWSRRYNQSGALARVIERQTGVKVTSEALRRVRPTQQQIGLSRTQRASNVQGAFKVEASRQSEIQGSRVILIDDVLTSGATVDACARALLRAKAASVDVLVFARVVDTHKAPI
jgi:ComF family protein